eukprot:950232-Pelagomonas_calceolata.AAC.2
MMLLKTHRMKDKCDPQANNFASHNASPKSSFQLTMSSYFTSSKPSFQLTMCSKFKQCILKVLIPTHNAHEVFYKLILDHTSCKNRGETAGHGAQSGLATASNFQARLGALTSQQSRLLQNLQAAAVAPSAFIAPPPPNSALATSSSCKLLQEACGRQSCLHCPTPPTISALTTSLPVAALSSCKRAAVAHCAFIAPPPPLVLPLPVVPPSSVLVCWLLQAVACQLTAAVSCCKRQVSMQRHHSPHHQQCPPVPPVSVLAAAAPLPSVIPTILAPTTSSAPNRPSGPTSATSCWPTHRSCELLQAGAAAQSVRQRGELIACATTE